MRSGVIAKKLGSSRLFLEGVSVPVTLLKIESCQVVGVKTVEKDGYSAVQMGAGSIKEKRVSKALKGIFSKSKVGLKRQLKEFRVSPDALLDVGFEVKANHYVVGQFVDIQGRSKGKGFAGGMKRHNFGGLEATHGVSISHRSHGSTGQCQDPGKVFKGKKMAGHLGDVNVTKQNIVVMDADVENNILVVSGSVPGSKGSYVYIKDSVKKVRPIDAPYPAFVESSADVENKEVSDES